METQAIDHSECTGDCCACKKLEPTTLIRMALRALDNKDNGRHHCAPPTSPLKAFLRILKDTENKE